jgi:hypothetical protein
MILPDLIDEYSISGRNQNENHEVTYKGVLSLSNDALHIIFALDEITKQPPISYEIGDFMLFLDYLTYLGSS